MRNIKFVVLGLFLAVTLSACYMQEDIGTSQNGLQLRSNQILKCVGPGIYTDGDYFSDIVKIDTGTLTFEVNDPSVATQDTQIVGLTVTIQARRSDVCEDLTNLYTKWPALMDNTNLQSAITATASEAMKTGVRSMTLEQLLNDRNGLSNAINTALSEDALKYGTQIVNVSIKDVQLDPAYEAKLKEKAEITVNIEIAERRQDQIAAEAAAERIKQEELAKTYAAQLVAEQAKTEVDVEIASREGQKINAENSVYLTNDAAYQLERLRLLEKVLGDKTVVYFIPQGSDLTLFLNPNQSNVVPVPSE